MYICVKVRLRYQLESLTDLLALFEISKIFKRGKYIYIYIYICIFRYCTERESEGASSEEKHDITKMFI